MIQLQRVSLYFGTRELFEDLSAVFDQDQKIGLVGRNGAGKSTLLKAIAGQLPIDGGSISIERGKTLAYLPQEVVLESEKSVFDETYTVFKKFTDLEIEKESTELLLSQEPKNALELIERYNTLLFELQKFDKPSAIGQTHKILSGLGFTELMKQQPVAILSVGWKMRLVLAKLLLENADFYLFDEPTNHLDMVTKEWFFEFLRHSQFGYLLVSHDRYFLDHACDYIFELERGKAHLFTGGFSAYIKQKEQDAYAQQVAFDRQQKDIDRKQANIDRFRASASRAKMAQSLIKQLDKIERIEVQSPLPTITLKFPEVQRSGTVVLSVKNLKKSFDGKTVFQHAQTEIMRGEKVAVIAPNGGGKTTFFNVITGTYKPDEGSVQFGHNVHYAVFEQDQTKALNPKNTIFQEVLDACPQITESTIRGFLGSFLFSGDDIYKKISVLSGGERNRVAMIKVLLQKANFLLLDEPTNHLDLYAKEVLLQALQQYDGTILFVSHDHDFLQKVATRILELTPDGLLSYPGNYESYIYSKKYGQQESKQVTSVVQEFKQQPPVQQRAPEKVDQKQLYLGRKELKTLESKINRFEKEIAEMNKSFEKIEYGSEEYTVSAKKFEAHKKQLQEMQTRWEELVKILS